MRFLTIGTFDGVHKGHIELISRLKKLAKKHKLESGVLYFAMPPKAVMFGAQELSVLTLPAEKETLLQKTGVDFTGRLNFKRCRDLSRENFFDLLIKTYKMKGLLVGRDFAFGKNRRGQINFLRMACKKHGVELVVEDFYKDGGHKISSSRIRKALHDGDVKEANKLLGRPYSVSGLVVTGKQLGRRLGFPTANLDTGIYKILPQGIFAVEVLLGKERFKGVANIGFRPTVNTIYDNIPLVEVHILDFNRDIYSKDLTINFVKKIRGEKKFDGLDALVAQIKQDAADAEKYVKF
ncbi:riboflavin kinase/FMN adenylyltransferase [Elusimicrobium posterum]|uniref:riboflavin biosynthesis protein RibF n=1 Tax=Elusimicrobium posterum TaxID=3116653 RepID=UPI003C75E9E1